MLYVYGLFNGALCSSDYLSLNGEMINKHVIVSDRDRHNVRYYRGILHGG